MSDPILGQNLYIAPSCLVYRGLELAFRFSENTEKPWLTLLQLRLALAVFP